MASMIMSVASCALALIQISTGVAAPAGAGASGTQRDSMLTRVASAQLDTVASAVEALRTPDRAATRGYRRLSARKNRTELNPIMGEHWINVRHLREDSISLLRPAFLMFYPIGGERTLVGVAYAGLQPVGAPLPDRFDGGMDHWHVHLPCTQVGELQVLLARDADDCRRFGGRPRATQMAMVHVWLNVPNPAGRFAPDNPALPFIATGLRPPSTSDLGDARRGMQARILALALGEMLGATPRLGSLIGRQSWAPFARGVGLRRDAIRAHVSELRTAEASADSVRYRRAAAAIIGEWRHIREAYLAAAVDDVHRELMRRWYDEAVGQTVAAHAHLVHRGGHR